jgi:hypothetical protein
MIRLSPVYIERKLKMDIFPATPPNPVRKRRVTDTNFNYRDLVNKLADEPNTWFRVQQLTVAGTTIGQKQASIAQAARRRGYTVQTSAQDGMLYARIVTEAVSQ